METFSSACGFGLLGLCCSACLSGPCRISPFERDRDPARCGAGPDGLVAVRLIQHVAADTAGALQELKNALRDLENGTGKTARERSDSGCGSLRLKQKYSLEDPSEIADALTREAINLLAPVSFPGSSGPFSSALRAAGVGPELSSGLSDSPPGTLLLEALASLGSFEPDAEAQLRRCLRLARLGLMARELKADIDLLTGDPVQFRKKEIDLKSVKSPQIIVLDRMSARESPAGILKHIREEAGDCAVIRVESLEAVMALLLPVLERDIVRTDRLLIAFTRSAAEIVGSLLLGIDVSSFPPLPIHGGASASRFFHETLQGICGAVYVNPSGEYDFSFALSRLRRGM